MKFNKKLKKLILNSTVWFIILSIFTSHLSVSTYFPTSFVGTVEAVTNAEPELKVAFIGDTNYSSGFTNVLNLIKSEGADIVMHQGDFDYSYDADGFFAKVDSILGPDFPYFGSVGNHDTNSWNDGCSDSDGCYATFFKQRMERIGVVPDNPNLNDQMYAVKYRGLHMVFVGQNSNTGNQTYAPFIDQQLQGSDHVWKICSWHKNQTNMQLGTKSNDMQWGVYDTCREQGAIIATGHEHTYSRTKTLTNFESLTVDAQQHPPTNGVPGNQNNVVVEPGRTFAFVNGLGGASIRNQDRCLPTTYPYGGGSGCNYIWANVYTSDQGAKHGVLFITFNVNNDPNKAVGYFKNVQGETIDQFEITTTSTGGGTTPPPTLISPSPSQTPSPTNPSTPTPTTIIGPTVTTGVTPTTAVTPTQEPSPTTLATVSPTIETPLPDIDIGSLTPVMLMIVALISFLLIFFMIFL